MSVDPDELDPALQAELLRLQGELQAAVADSASRTPRAKKSSPAAEKRKPAAKSVDAVPELRRESVRRLPEPQSPRFFHVDYREWQYLADGKHTENLSGFQPNRGGRGTGALECVPGTGAGGWRQAKSVAPSHPPISSPQLFKAESPRQAINLSLHSPQLCFGLALTEASAREDETSVDAPASELQRLAFDDWLSVRGVRANSGGRVLSAGSTVRDLMLVGSGSPPPPPAVASPHSTSKRGEKTAATGGNSSLCWSHQWCEASPPLPPLPSGLKSACQRGQEDISRADWRDRWRERSRIGTPMVDADPMLFGSSLPESQSPRMPSRPPSARAAVVIDELVSRRIVGHKEHDHGERQSEEQATPAVALSDRFGRLGWQGSALKSSPVSPRSLLPARSEAISPRSGHRPPLRPPSASAPFTTFSEYVNELAHDTDHMTPRSRAWPRRVRTNKATYVLDG